MVLVLLLALATCLLAFLGYRGARIWLDTVKRGYPLARRFGWSLAGAVLPHRYWWGARIKAMSVEERDDFLTQETAALGLASADSLRCPLCGTEVPQAWALDALGRATTGPRPVECPRCDFRLDACRHCIHFLHGPGPSAGSSPWLRGAIGTGRCQHYQISQPVEQVCAPDLARRLRDRGYEQVRGPMPVADSYLPPDSCRAFAPDSNRMRENEVHWPDARRIALLRLLRASTPSSATTEQVAPRSR